MKKHIAIAAGLAVLSTSAFATKSRMEALGQDDSQGSFYIQDTRNVFRNAAGVNDMTNYVVTEWGSTASGNPEGGFFRSAGQFNYGVYLNSNVAGGVTHTNGTNTGALSEDNRVTAFVGGDMGVKWGASVYHSSSEDETAVKKDHGSMGLGLGVEKGAIDGYVNVKLKDEAKGNTAFAGSKSEADSMQVGLGYDWMDYKFFADYSKANQEVTNVTAGAGKAFETEVTTLIVGVGHAHEVSATSRLYTDLQYVSEETNDKVTPNKSKDTKLPLTIGFEADATSWLALRGSISQNVIIGSNKNNAGKKSLLLTLLMLMLVQLLTLVSLKLTV